MKWNEKGRLASRGTQIWGRCPVPIHCLPNPEGSECPGRAQTQQNTKMYAHVAMEWTESNKGWGYPTQTKLLPTQGQVKDKKVKVVK